MVHDRRDAVAAVQLLLELPVVHADVPVQAFGLIWHK